MLQWVDLGERFCITFTFAVLKSACECLHDRIQHPRRRESNQAWGKQLSVTLRLHWEGGKTFVFVVVDCQGDQVTKADLKGS